MQIISILVFPPKSVLSVESQKDQNSNYQDAYSDISEWFLEKIFYALNASFVWRSTKQVKNSNYAVSGLKK